jgi:hypothetical protein
MNIRFSADTDVRGGDRINGPGRVMIKGAASPVSGSPASVADARELCAWAM